MNAKLGVSATLKYDKKHKFIRNLLSIYERLL